MVRRSSTPRARSVLDDLIDDGRATLSTTSAAVRDTVVPAVRDTMVPVGETLRDQAVELAERSRPTRREAKRRAEAAVLALRGELPARRRRRWSTALLFLVAGGAAGAAAGLVIHRRQPEFGSAEVSPVPPPMTPESSTGTPTRVPSATVTTAEQPDSVTLPDDAPLTD